MDIVNKSELSIHNKKTLYNQLEIGVDFEAIY